MDVFLGLLLFVFGIALLDRAADWFTDAAVDVATNFRLPLVVVGLLTVGIEWEELAVVVVALAGGHEGLALGAIVGSAIANLTIVLALAVGSREVLAGTREQSLGALLLLGTVMLVVVGAFGTIQPAEGLLLILAYVGYMFWLGRQVMVEKISREPASEYEGDIGHSEERSAGSLRGWLIATTIGALALTLLGGELVVRGVLRIVDHTSLTQTTAGLTLVALGTSLPDALVSFRAARRGASPIVLANAAGSNLCNLLLLTGLLAVSGAVAVPGSVQYIDLPVLLAVTAAFTIVLARGSLGRGYAVTMAAVYIGYILARVV